MLQNHRHWLCAISKKQIDGKGAVMKKKILNELWLFAKIDLICWAIYFASVILILLIFYYDVPAGQRDYTVISWVQHIIFFIAYYIIYTRHINDEKMEIIHDEFSIKKTVITFFKKEYLQIILMSAFSVIFEVSRLIDPGPRNIVAAIMVMFIPSAGAIDIPVVRTLVGLSISMISILISTVLINYKKHKYWNTSKKPN